MIEPHGSHLNFFLYPLQRKILRPHMMSPSCHWFLVMSVLVSFTSPVTTIEVCVFTIAHKYSSPSIFFSIIIGHCHCIGSLISRFAPRPEDNNNIVYVLSVCVCQLHLRSFTPIMTTKTIGQRMNI